MHQSQTVDVYYVPYNEMNTTISIVTTGWIIGDSIPDKDRKGFFFFGTTSRLDLGPIQPPIRWVLWDLSPRGKAAESWIESALNYTSTLTYAFIAWCLVKHSI
jgi:hypothetical protein